MRKESATEISNHKIYCVIPSHTSLSFVISVVRNNWCRASQMCLISVPDTTERRSLSSETRIIQQPLMCGLLVALLRSLCSDSRFSRERVESTNWLKSSKFLEPHQENKFKQWTLNTKSTVSHKLDLYRGRRCSDTGPRARPLTLYPDYFNMIQKQDQLHFPLCSIHTLTSSEIRTVGFLTVGHCLTCSILLKTSIILSHRLFNNVSHPGIMVRNMERRHERAITIDNKK